MINIIIIGHEDHGKTTLTEAITEDYAYAGFSEAKKTFDQIDNPSSNEFLNLVGKKISTLKRNYALFDYPSHADYVKNMVTGSAQMDGAVLVVSASDGPMSQTREHIILAKQISIPKIVVFLNKADQVDDDQELLELVEMEVRDLLDFYEYDGNNDNCPVISGSALGALNGERNGKFSINKLMDSVDFWI